MRPRAPAALVRSSVLAVLAPLAAQVPAGQVPAEQVSAERAPVGLAAVGRVTAEVEHGRIEQHGALRLVRLWGTPQQRGRAHGLLLGDRICALMAAEFAARFGRRQGLLEMARDALPRLIDYPDDVTAELEALFAALEQRAVDRSMPALDREFDLDDLRIANALDVFGLMGCTGFTVWQDQVEGGGVLSGRNFDWPYTGRHMIDELVLLVQHDPGGGAVAAVTWPGYTGVVTGVNQDGVAGYLHVGSARLTMTPEPGSWPTATALRAILEQARLPAGRDPGEVFELARDRLSWTSPPAGFLTRVVLPRPPLTGSPRGLFEADSRKVVQATVAGPAVVTNHFQARRDGRDAAKDSLDRHRRVCEGLDGCLQQGDRKVSIGEGWAMLESVQRGGHHGFGTLHSLLFRHEPWCFELRVADWDDERGLVPAPVSQRRFALSREAVFPGRSSGR